MNIKWLGVLLAIAAVLVVVTVLAHRRKPEMPSASVCRQIVEELGAVDVWIGSLTPDNGGTTLAYINGTENGRQLTLVDLKTLQSRRMATTNEVTYIFGWAPNDRYLAFTQIPYQPEKIHQKTPQFFESWLTLYDRQDGSMRRLTEDTNVMEVPFFWLPGGDYLVSSRNLTNDYGELFLGKLNGDERSKVANFAPGFVIVSDRMGAYSIQSELYTLELKPLRRTEKGWDLKSRAVQKISEFKPNGFNELSWLRYAPAQSNFLFCARSAQSNWRYLYQFDPATQNLIQLSQEDTYNGQWLQNGRGYAYVINTNNSFQLAVRPADASGNTNLFQQGNVVTYTAAPDGERLYVLASLGVEPHGIWEYSIPDRMLRKVAEALPQPLETSRIVEPEEFQLKSFDEVRVPCFLFPPTALLTRSSEATRSIIRPRKKYPLVIFVPPASYQFQRKFDHQAQVLANCGFFFAAINYRGCDGYGVEYSALANPKDAAGDVLALYDKLKGNPDIDYNNVFLLTSSGGVQVIAELVATRPTLWRGVGLDKPAGNLGNSRFEPGKLPPILVVIGELDPALGAIKSFVGWAQTNRVSVQSVIHTNTGHVTYNVADRKDTLHQLTEFFLRHVQ